MFKRAQPKKVVPLLLPMGLPKTEEELQERIRRSKKLVTKRALVSAGASLVPIPGINVTIDISLMATILNAVNAEFGLDPKEISALPTAQRLEIFSCITAVGSAWAGKVITVQLVMSVLKKVSVQMTAVQVTKWIPILGQAASAGISFAAMKFIGNRHIRDCIEIARLYMQENQEKAAVAESAEPAREAQEEAAELYQDGAGVEQTGSDPTGAGRSKPAGSDSSEQTKVP